MKALHIEAFLTEGKRLLPKTDGQTQLPFPVIAAIVSLLSTLLTPINLRAIASWKIRRDKNFRINQVVEVL